MYEEIKSESKQALFYNVYKGLRKLLVIYSGLLLSDYPTIQINILVIHSLLMVIYIFKVRPFQTKKFNRIELFNEGCYLICTLHLFMLTDYVNDPLK